MKIAKKKSGKGNRTSFECSLAPLSFYVMSKEKHPYMYLAGLGWDGHQLIALSTLTLGGQDADFTVRGAMSLFFLLP